LQGPVLCRPVRLRGGRVDFSVVIRGGLVDDRDGAGM
jgi:hypothetical protein